MIRKSKYSVPDFEKLQDYTRDIFLLPVLLISILLLISLCASPAYSAEEKAVIKGKVSDIEGKAVKGASVFVYDSPDMRRRVDFVSSPSEVDGSYRMSVPPGKYWLASRLRREGRYALGPLMSDDKFSGDPKEVELAPGAEVNVDFTVMNLRETTRIKKKTSEAVIKIKGRILEENGTPVKNFYAFANKSGKVPAIPDYVSSWTDEDGSYTLFLPKGKYHLGASAAFPKDKDFTVNEEISVETDKSDLDIVINSKK